MILNEQGDVLGGYAGVPGWLRKATGDIAYHPFQTYGGGCWVDARTTMVSKVDEGGLIKFWRPWDDPQGQHTQQIWNPPVAGYNGSGGGTRWIEQGEAPDRSSVLYTSVGAVPAAGFGDVAFDGTIAFKTIYQSYTGVTIVPPGVSSRWPPFAGAVWPRDLPAGWISIPDAPPTYLQALPGGTAIAYGGWAYGRAVPRPYYADAMGLKLVRVGNEDWLLYWSNARPGLVFQPDGASEGYVLDTEGFAFNHDVTGGTTEATICSSRTQGEAPGDLWLLRAGRHGCTTIVDWKPGRPTPQWQSLKQSAPEPQPPEPSPIPPPQVTITDYTPPSGTAPLTVTATWAAEGESGPITELHWQARVQGDDEWADAAVNPPEDPDHHYRFSEPGTYEIRLLAIGPGGTGATGKQRLVTVTADTPIPPEPPRPTPEDSMAIYLKLGHFYVGVEPTPLPDESGDARFPVYADREEGGAWEEVELTKQEDGLYEARFVASNRTLSIQPDGTLETREGGSYGGYEAVCATTQPDGASILYRKDDDVVIPTNILTIEDRS